MKYGNYEIHDYIEMLDGKVEGCTLVKAFCGLAMDVGIYENENGKFLIENFNKEDEFIYKLIKKEL